VSGAAIAELDALAERFRLPVFRLDALRGCRPAFDLVPYAEAHRRGCVVVRSEAGELLAVLGDPYDAAAQDWLEERLRDPFSWRLAHPGEIAAYLAQQEEGLRAMDGVALESAAAGDEELQDLSIEAISEADSAVVKLVNSTLYDALKAGASDIHLETGARGLAIKYRVDGVLAAVRTAEGIELADQVVSRVKVLAELDISERRVPQDGRFRVRSKAREIDFRVSVMPSVFGEDAVLRILDKRALADQHARLTLEQLGFEPDTIARLRELANEPHGMLLVTGPTGSGKTTTLYAAISEVNTGLDKIVTIEDPVEYQLLGVLQIPVNEKKGLTFARGLRSILRHDPDRIMVGEIRDPETAEIAVQSALTGHLVFTTVHANNVFDVVGRFMHMGVDPFNFASALNAVLAQRLVRTFCKACAGKGCAECRGAGFRGRKAIAELMVLDDGLRELIVGRAPARRLKEAARGTGTGTLREAALRLVERGETSLEEINRVTSVAS
jgi:general secretion pathway protein E